MAGFDSDDITDFLSIFEIFINLVMLPLIGVVAEVFWILADATFLTNNMPFLIVLILLLGGYVVLKKNGDV